MTLVFSEEQNMLAESISRYFQDRCVLSSERRRNSIPSDWDERTWKGLADELGVLGLNFSEAEGGMGGGAVETMIVMEAIGDNLVVLPFLETAVIAPAILRASGGAVAGELTPQIIAGDARIAFAHAEFQARYCVHDVRLGARRDGDDFVLEGAKAVITGAANATHYIVSARTGGGPRDRQGISLFLVDPASDGISRRDYRTIDWHPASDIRFENVVVPASALLGTIDAALPLIERVIDLATLAVCAEGTATLRKIVQATTDYAKQRRQFGAALSSFQVLRHRMVDMHISVEEAMAMSREASQEWDSNQGWADETLALAERARNISALKVCVGNACNFVGESGIQIHGGMGITDELAVSHYFKRAKVIQQIFGSIDHHVARFEATAFAQRPEPVA